MTDGTEVATAQGPAAAAAVNQTPFSTAYQEVGLTWITGVAVLAA